MATHTITYNTGNATFTWQDPVDEDEFKPAADAGWTQSSRTCREHYVDNATPCLRRSGFAGGECHSAFLLVRSPRLLAPR